MLQLNLANALLQGGQPGEAATISEPVYLTYKEDGNGKGSAGPEGALGNRDQELAARLKKHMALVASWSRRFHLLSSASSMGETG